MASSLNRSKLLQGYSGGLFDQLEFLTEDSADTLVIHRGLLLLMAFWSGPSVLGFKNLCRVFKLVGLPGGFTFRVLDIDVASDSLLKALSRYPVTIGGNAEGYWFRDGSIFAATAVHTASDTHIQLLLAESTRS